uniref:Bm11653 n=1 Tax=Brugia malayi TaxID=6279 RepID=A0A1I9G7J0_BRUMA|nr:Bm11653 [Brugia malayi]
MRGEGIARPDAIFVVLRYNPRSLCSEAMFVVLRQGRFENKAGRGGTSAIGAPVPLRVFPGQHPSYSSSSPEFRIRGEVAGVSPSTARMPAQQLVRGADHRQGDGRKREA